MKIEKIFQEKRPIFSFEIFPPKKELLFKDIDALLMQLSDLQPDFISVTFGAGGSGHNNATIQIAQKIKQDYGIEPIIHLTCLHYSKQEIQDILKELKEKNIQNILALRGDENPQLERKEDFHYASELTAFIHNYDSDFDVCGACYPEVHFEAKNMEEDIENLRKKVDAGATHLISQLFFDNQLFYNFQQKAKENGICVPIEAGIMPVVNKKQIERMVSMCGASLPAKFTKMMQKYEKNEAALFDAGIAYAINQIVDLLAHDVDGIHLYTMNNPLVAKRIYEGIKTLL